jgi:cell wall-associated NlpC family hydrolase
MEMTNRTIGKLPEGLPTVVSISGCAAVLEEPHDRSTVETQLLFGERVVVFGDLGDWLDVGKPFGEYCHRGFVRRSVLAESRNEATHRVWEPWTPVRSIPRLKAVVINRLSLGSELRVIGETEDHYQIWPYGWVFQEHVRPIDVVASNFVDTIRRFVGTPFVWGGRSSFGLDCSGMIQLGMQLAGVSAPRAMIDMRDALGQHVEDRDRPMPGDFIFYSEHCGMFVDESHVINSNGRAGRVQIEPLDELHYRMVKDRAYSYIGRRRLALDDKRTDG